MFTAKALNKRIADFLISLDVHGFHIEKAILFGSYAKGKPNDLSDIDLAIWIANFPKKHYTDDSALLKIVSSHHPIKPKFYGNEENAETDPFIEVIQKTGKEILLPVKG